MLEKNTLARPYANAVFDLAKSEDKLAKWSEILELLEHVVAAKEMRPVINHPKVSNEKLAELILDICGDKLDKQGQNFVKVLIGANRLDVVPQIRTLFEKLRSEAEGVATIEVISAYALEDSQQENIKQIMAKRLGRDVELTTRVDETLIGGAVIRTGDSVIDASVRGRLKQVGQILQSR